MMKLLMENWRKFLTEIDVFEKDAAVSTVLSKLGSSDHYPEIDDAEVFLNRQASRLMIRVPMVHQMIRVINQDLDITEQDVLEILLQRALKGRTYEELTRSEQEYMEKYGLKYPEEKEEQEIEIPSYSREDIPPELMDAGTQVFVPSYAKKEGLMRENVNKEDNVVIADALLSLVLNVAHAGTTPPELYALDDEELRSQIELHNHNEEVSNEELYNFIRG